MREIYRLLLFLLCVFLVGCPTHKPIEPMPAPITLYEAIQNYNNNVAAIAAFQAKINTWEAQFPDPNDQDKTHHHKARGGRIRYRPGADQDSPASLYLTISDIGVGEVLTIGSNENEYWMYRRARDGYVGRWGKYANIDKPCAKKIPLHPQGLLDAIGLRMLPVDPAVSPYPVYKVTPTQYIIEYVIMTERGVLLRREILIDRRSNLPVSSNTYDQRGQVIMTSTMDDYHPLGDAMLPGSVHISWPQTNSFFAIELRTFKIKNTYRIDPFIRRLRSDIDYQQLCKDD